MQEASDKPKSRRGLIVGIVLGVVVVLVLVGVGFVALIGGVMKSSGAYKDAMERAAGDCRVEHAIGVPLEAGRFVSGSVETSGASGYAELSIPVEGTTGAGTLQVIAEKAAGTWNFRLLQLDVAADGSRIDLLSADASCPDGPPAGDAATPPVPPADAGSAKDAAGERPGSGAPSDPAASTGPPAAGAKEAAAAPMRSAVAPAAAVKE